MTMGVLPLAASPGAAGADLGFWLQSLVVGQPMAMREEHLRHLVESISANRFSLPRNRKTGARITEKGTAIVEVHGVLIDRAPILGTFWGLAAYEGLAEQFRRLATHDDVKRIVLDIDSPGGMVRGIEGCAEELARLAARKPVHAIAHDMACSAGYWMGCVAESLSVTRDGEVGSIGVRAGHVSYAEMMDRAGIRVTMLSAGATKVDGSPYAFLSDGEHAERIYDIERTYDRFVAHVAAHRPMTAEAVRETDARCFTGADAVSARLADKVESLDELVERIERKAAKVVPKRKPATEPGSKAGLGPKPDGPREDDEEVDEVRSRRAAAGSRNESRRTPTKEGASTMDDQSEMTAVEAFQTLITEAVKSIRKDDDKPAAAATPPADTEATRTAAAVSAALDRVFAVLECEEAKAHPALALALAKSGLPLDAAKGILAAAPKADAKSDAGNAAALGNALERQMARSGNSGGVKPDAGRGGSLPSLAEKIEKRFAVNTKKRG